MKKDKTEIIRSARLTSALDEALKDIARYENRSVSNIIQRFLTESVTDYIIENPGMFEELNTLEKEREKDFERFLASCKKNNSKP